MKPLTIRKDILDKFSSLCSELSPENLTGDGELSERQVHAKLGRISKEWAELERRLGRKVSKDEVYKNSSRRQK